MSLDTPPVTEPASERRHGRFSSEMMAGGSVVEKTEDELVGGWRGAAGIATVVALFALLGYANLWWFLFAMGILVAIFLHELGHYVTARWTGMKATQFFIGFGPRVWSFRRGETEYGLRLLPLGAFVRIIGMNSMDDVEAGDEARTYRSKSYPRRMLVISAGSIMHIIQAVLLLFVVYVARGEMVERPGAEVAVPASSAAADATVTGAALAAGIEPGDVIVAIDGAPVDGSVALGTLVRTHAPGDTVAVSILRDGQAIELSATLVAREAGEGIPAELVGAPVLGVSTGNYFETVEHGVGAAAVNSVTDIFPVAWESTKGVIKAINPVNVFTHVTGSNDDITTRPTTVVGVTGISDDVGRSQGVFGVLFLLAVLNVFIGVFNMFPLLPLDGGHAAIATYERIRELRLRAGERYHADVAKLMPFAMAVVTLLGFLFLSGLYLDITDPL
ncbi:MAG TPA: site-2 protease family protein [Ilumatobacter sp.]|nr:site-2 protease family protein [Ilumatobacter sp.]